MKNAVLIKSLLFFILLFSFSFYIVQASTPQKDKSKKQQIIASLMQKAKKAMLSGNKKQADIYWQQINSLDPQRAKPIWLSKNISNQNKPESQLTILEEKQFIKLMNELPYEKAKIELDKRLFFSPNNNKLRLLYIELAKKNNDKEELEKHSNLLGIKQPKPFDYKLLFKYVLIIVIILLIIYEIFKILKNK